MSYEVFPPSTNEDLSAAVTAPESEQPGVDILDEVQKEHPEIERRLYQVECLDALSKSRERGQKRALIHMATGLGKTTVAATDVKGFLEEHPGARVLFLCHQNAILEQARERFEFIVGTDDYTYGYFTGESKDTHEVTCLFASFQTMKNWKRDFRKDEFDYIVVDESHHGKAETYAPTLRYFKPKFLLGMTATPDRKDLQDIREIFGRAVYSKSLAQALAEGLLAKPEYLVIVDDIQQGLLEDETLSLTELNRTIFIPRRDEEIARIVLEKINEKNIDDPRIISFCPSIEHAHRFSKLLPNAKALHSGMSKKERQAVLEAFRNGALSGVVTVDIFNEGIDIADANVIVFLRPTQSETIFIQQLGRGLRKLPHKDSVLVLDFVANCDRLLMIERLLHEITQAYRKKQDTAMKPGKEYELLEASETDSSLELETVKQDLSDIRNFNLGDFEFTETTRQIMEVIKRIQSRDAQPLPEGWVSVNTFVKANGISHTLLYRLLDESGISLPALRFGTNISRGLSPETQQQLLELPELQVEPAPEGWMSVNSFSKAVRASGDTIRKLLNDIDTSELRYYKFGPTITIGLSPGAQRQLLELPQLKTAVAPGGYVTIEEFAQTINISPTTLRRIIDELEVEPSIYRFGRSMAVGLSPEQQATIIELPQIKTPPMPEGWKSLNGFAKEQDVSAHLLRGIIKELGWDLPVYRGRSRIVYGLNPEQQKHLINFPEINTPKAPKGWRSTSAFAREIEAAPKTIRKIIKKLEIETTPYKFGPKIVPGISPKDQARIIIALGGH